MADLPAPHLAIVPGATHVSLATEKVDVWLPMMKSFLDAPPPDGQEQDLTRERTSNS